MCVAASKLATLWHKNLENLSSCGPPQCQPHSFPVAWAPSRFLCGLHSANGTAAAPATWAVTAWTGPRCARASESLGLRAWTQRQDAGSSCVGCSQARLTFIGLVTRPAAALPSRSLSPGHGWYLSSGNVQVALHWPCTLHAPVVLNGSCSDHFAGQLLNS